MINLPRLKTADLEVPQVPVTDTQPEVIGVDCPLASLIAVGGAGALTPVGDQFGLRLNEELAARVGRCHTQHRPTLLQPPGGIWRVGAFARDLLVAAVDPE